MRFLTFASACAALVAASVTGCQSAAHVATRKPQPLSYVGTIRLGPPVVSESEITVALEYEGGEWLANSAIVPVMVKSTVKDKEIDITVITAVAGGAAGANPGPGYRLVLPADLTGDYKVFYVDPDECRHFLDVVRIPR